MNKIIRLIIAIVCGYIAAALLSHIIPIRILFYPELMLVAWGAWTSMPRFIPALQAPATAAGKPIDVLEDGDWSVIKATPAPLPVVRFSIISAFVGLCIAFLTIMFSGGNNPSSSAVFKGLLVGVIASVLIFLLAKASNNKRRGVQSGPFAVRADAIRLPTGTVVTKVDMYRILITNPTDDAYNVNPFYTGNTMSTTMIAAHSALNASNIRAMEKVAFIVNLEHGGVRSPLAGGLTEPQAHAVFQEICKRVDTFQSS